MPKNLFQEIVFTVMMVFVMVYAMICYNIALNIGGMTNEVFLLAFKELVIMGPIAFVLDIFLVGRIAKYKTFKMINPERDNPFFIVLGISVISVIFMCPLMSLAATLLFKKCGKRSYCGVDSDNDNQFSYGSVLAIILCGSCCKNCFLTYIQREENFTER